MPSAVKSLVAPVYLLACLILGGSAQGIWQNMLLQLAGLAIIAWAAAAGDNPLPKAARTLLPLVKFAESTWNDGVVPLRAGVMHSVPSPMLTLF